MAYTDELVAYISRQLRACVSEQEIQTILEKSGWSSSDIHEALQSAQKTLSSQDQPQTCAVRVDFTQTSQHTIAPIHKSKRRYVIVGIVLICIAAGGAYAYARYTQSPSRILARMLRVLPTVQSVEATASFDATLTVPNTLLSSSSKKTSSTTQPVDVHLAISSSQFMRFTEQTDNTFKFSVHAEYTDSLTQKAPLQLTLDSFGLKDVAYGKVSGLSGVLSHLLGSPIPGISSLENQWFYINRTNGINDFTAVTESLRGSTSSTDETSTPSTSLSATEKKKQVVAILDEYKTKIVSDAENMGTETLEGIPTSHIRVTLQETTTLEMIQKIKNILAEDPSANVSGPLPIQSFDIWVGTQDYLPYKITMHSSPAFLSKMFTNDQIVPKNIELTISHAVYNTPLSLTPPSDAKNLEETVSQLLGGLFGSPPEVKINMH